MTYRGSLPHGHGSGFNGQQHQYQHQNQYPQSTMPNGYDPGWGSAQQYQPQYQEAVFAPVAYQNNQQPHNVHQHQNQHPSQTQTQTQTQHQHQHQHQQHMQPQNPNYQSPSYDPSFDQRPYQPHQPPSQSPLNASPQFLPPTQQQQQHQQHQHAQQISHQNQYGQQHMNWQQMPPPMPMPSPSNSYQPSPPQVASQLQRQQNPVQQHVNSPIMAQSPQFVPQSIPNHNNNNRNPSASARMEQASRVSASPRLTSQGITRSPSVSSTRSPAPAPGLIPHHVDTNSLLISVAEEFFTKAREESRGIAATVDAQSLHEYQKLVATGLGCLEVVLGSNRLAPRLEARIRLRYASILCEETNNVMEAETALTKGITLCERNRFADLKYLMQFLQVKLLFSQRKERAAMIAVDGRIRDAEVLKHTHWVYAFRFLKVSLYLQSANPTEAHALENLRAITALASQRGDRAILIVTSLLEGLSLLRVMKDDAVVRIQACIAQAAKYQLDDSVRILQLDILALMLDLACSLHQKSPKTIAQKLKALQHRMDASINDNSWSFGRTTLLIPIQKQSINLQVISEDTSAILMPGAEGDSCDALAMSFWSKLEAFTMTYIYSGLALPYQQPRNDPRMVSLWDEALSQLQKNRGNMRGYPSSLEDAVKNADWEREVKCYLHILRGLHFATYTRWSEVTKCIRHLESMVKPPLEGIVVLYSAYLAGVYHQGTGDLATASIIYSNANFSLEAENMPHGNRKPAEVDVSLLATFNRIWIMQHPSQRDDQLTIDLLERLRPLCTDHPNLEIRTAYNLVQAAVQTNPPIPMTSVKSHISTALNNAKILGDVQTLSIALNLMRAKLFQSIVGDQALKSAKAASTQAKKSGNTLWMSVADGMLAQSYDVQGQGNDAQKSWQDAIEYARLAFKTEE